MHGSLVLGLGQSLVVLGSNLKPGREYFPFLEEVSKQEMEQGGPHPTL